MHKTNFGSRAFSSAAPQICNYHIPILLSESHRHLTPSNVTSKLTTLPRHNSHHVVTIPYLWCIFLNSGALPILFVLHYITLPALSPCWQGPVVWHSDHAPTTHLYVYRWCSQNRKQVRDVDGLVLTSHDRSSTTTLSAKRLQWTCLVSRPPEPHFARTHPDQPPMQCRNVKNVVG